MYIHDQRKPLTCNLGELGKGELFAWEDEEDLFYLMVIDNDDAMGDYGIAAVVLGARESDTHLTGTIWTFKPEDEIQPLNGEVKVWAK